MDATFEQLLTATGLADLPGDMRSALAGWFAEELQLRSGEALSEGMGEDLLAESEAMNNGDTAVISTWLAANVANFENDPLYMQIYDAVGDRAQAVHSFAARRWLDKHRPEHPRVVHATYDALARELAHAAPQIRSLYREIV